MIILHMEKHLRDPPSLRTPDLNSAAEALGLELWRQFRAWHLTQKIRVDFAMVIYGINGN